MTHLRTKLIPLLALGAALLLPATVFAQGTGGFGDPVPTPTETPEPTPTPEPAPPPPEPVYTPTPTPPAPTPAAEPASTTAVTAPVSAPATARPDGMSFGLGINYVLGGAALDRPDGASFRLRLASGLTLEPFVRLATHGQATMDGDTKNAQNEFFVGSNVRLPLMSRGKVDLVGQAGGSLGVFVNDLDGDDNNTTTTTFLIDYGLSLEYWYSANWALSFTAQNRFLRYASTSQQASDSLTATDTDIGVIWDPVVDLALHLFY